MEDKRTLLAFLLIGLILLAIPYYYELTGMAPKPQAPQEQPASPEEPRSAAPEAQPAPPRAPAAAPAELAAEERTQGLPGVAPTPSESFTPRRIVVRTPLQQLEFSTEGGVLTSAKLFKYKYMDGEVVDLIPPGGRGLAVALSRGESEQDLSRIEFVPDREGIRIDSEEQARLSLRADLGGGRSIEKVLRFSGDRYGVEMDLNYRGFGQDDTWALVGWEKGIANTETKPGSDLPGGLAGAQAIGAVAFMNDERITVDDDVEVEEENGPLSWAGVSNQYFFLALAPLEDGYYHVALYSQPEDRVFEWKKYAFRIGARVSGTGTWRTLLYPGPLDYEELLRYEADLERGIDLGWPVIRHISKVLLIIFLAVHSVVPNYGWVLILFAVAIKILVYPLTHKSYESMARMQEVQPKIAALREKFKNDQQRLSQATMKLYKEEGVNPLGGCLPMLLQMPIFFALYKLFYNIELRQAPFVLWIKDLSRPEEILIAGFGLHVLPVLMAGSMLLQQKMTMKDPKQAFMVYLMPAFLLFIFWSLPSGLVLYWTVFNILTILQQMLINHLKKGGALGGPALGRP